MVPAAHHGVGKPVSKLIDERADVLAFLDLALAPQSGRPADSMALRSGISTAASR